MVETVWGMTDLQIKLVTAAGQLALAGMVVYVAWQQWQTARNKLKLDLFDRRFSAHNELRNLITEFRHSQTRELAQAIGALIPTYEYLFSREAGQTMIYVTGHALAICGVREALGLPPKLKDGEVAEVDYDRWVAAESKISRYMASLANRYKEVVDLTAGSLQLSH